MKRPYLTRGGKIAAFVLAVVLLAGTFWSGVVTLANWDDLWSGGNYYDSSSILTPLYNGFSRVREVMELDQEEEWSGRLNYSQKERREKLLANLDASATNFRYQVHDENGTLLRDNLNGELLEEEATRIRLDTFSRSTGSEYADQDRWRSDSVTGEEYLLIATPDGDVRLDPAALVENQYNDYGYRYYDGEYYYDPGQDQRLQKTTFVIEFGVHTPLTANDEFLTHREDYEAVQRWLPLVSTAAGLLLTASVALLVLLCRSAGRRREDGALVLSWHDRIPLDLYLFVGFWIFMLILLGGDSTAYSFSQYATLASFVGVTIFSCLVSAQCLFCLLTVVVRLKSHTFWSNTLCARLWRKLREAFSQWSIIARAVVLFLLYLTGTVITTLTIVLIPVFQGFVLWHICRYVKQWRVIRQGTIHMVSGQSEYTIDTHRMYPDLKEHAESLNNLGAGMARAVEQQLKGERFKAELITNVSHDLKTPLTSIINYVDLLKKVEIGDPAAMEYIDVLERKSQRLKKLTEDLVEASKASTGNLAVNREKLGFTQLLNQALGEYEEKLAQNSLTVVTTMPDHELYVQADGRHLWRVLDNLLGNCAKYAMPDTRVYVDVKAWDGCVCLSVKNISRGPLNIPPEQLLERFVRGDQSRTTEGSGLGLSIAQSLTELQGGAFRLDIDGDLFKAVVTFPEHQDPIALPGE